MDIFGLCLLASPNRFGAISEGVALWRNRATSPANLRYICHKFMVSKQRQGKVAEGKVLTVVPWKLSIFILY